MFYTVNYLKNYALYGRLMI